MFHKFPPPPSFLGGGVDTKTNKFNHCTNFQDNMKDLYKILNRNEYKAGSLKVTASEKGEALSSWQTGSIISEQLYALKLCLLPGKKRGERGSLAS